MKTKRLISITTVLFLMISTLFFSSCDMKKGDYAIQEGAAAFQRKEFDKAIGLFQMGLSVECSMSTPTVYIMISNCYSQKGDYDSAIEWRNKALEITEDSENYLNLGMIYRIKQDDETAEKMFRKALDLDPDSAPAYASLGALCITHDRIDEALALFEEAEAINPRSGIIQADLAICYAHKGDFEKADEHLGLAEDYKAENLPQFKAEIESLRANHP